MNLDRFDAFIRSLKIKKDRMALTDMYPFSLPAVKHIDGLEFHPNVTFIVGENGSGKSTILEAIAVAYGFNPEGGTKNFNFSSYESHSILHDYITVVKGADRPNDGFFLRAESFYNVASKIDEYDRQETNAPRIIDQYGGVSLHEQSHGESFMSLMLHRFRNNGIYILDEPEAALSPSRQLTMLARLHELVEQGCQFIIATHSPILMAYPNATIYQIQDEMKQVTYKETEHYQITKSFLDYPERMLRVLMEQNE